MSSTRGHVMMDVSFPTTAKPTLLESLRKEVGVPDHMLKLGALHAITQKVWEDIPKLRKEDEDIPPPMSLLLFSRRVEDAIAQSRLGDCGNMATCTGDQLDSRDVSRNDVLSADEIAIIDRLIAATGPEDGVLALQDFLHILSINVTSAFRHVMVVEVFLQSGGLSFLQKCVSPPFHLVAIGNHIIQFIGANGLEVQMRTIVDFGDIAPRIVKSLQSDDSGLLFAALRYFVKFPRFQNLLASHGKIPIISGHILRGTQARLFQGDDRDVLRMLAASDNPAIHQQLVACSVSSLDVVSNVILHSKCAGRVWRGCCDKVAALRKAALTADVTTATADATSAATASAAPVVAMDTLNLGPVETDVSSYSGGHIDKHNECDRLAAAAVDSCLQEMAGRFFSPFDKQWDTKCCKSAMESYISSFEGYQGIQFFIQVAVIFSNSSLSVCRKYTIPMVEVLLEIARVNEVALFTRLPEWALLKERIATWVSSHNSQLAGKARLFVSRHALGPPTLLNICLQCISEGILQKEVKSRLCLLPPSLLRQLAPARVPVSLVM